MISLAIIHMKKTILIVLLSITRIFGQTEAIENAAVDSLYREDQFYFNITNNSLQNTPSGYKQNRFSPGLGIGFLRDMPLNKKRTFAIAVGCGYSVSILNQNLRITDDNQTNKFAVISDYSYDKNKYSMHYVDLPIEFRWRTSTPTNTEFWRIYTGFKFSYLLYNQYKFEGDNQNLSLTNIPEINKIQYGCYLSAGWNTFNVYVLYGLNPLFKSTAIGLEPINATTLNFGLQFYIL